MTNEFILIETYKGIPIYWYESQTHPITTIQTGFISDVRMEQRIHTTVEDARKYIDSLKVRIVEDADGSFSVITPAKTWKGLAKNDAIEHAKEFITNT